jgi:hypothetical protein
VEGQTWSEGTGILNADGSERSAMNWLANFLESRHEVGYPFNGFTEPEDPTGEASIRSDSQFRVFPNPASEGIRISGIEKADLQVLDALGRIILSFRVRDEGQSLDLTSLAPGLYYLRSGEDVVLLMKR